MIHIAIVGLGDMGIGMAENFLKAGFDVSGFDLRKERLQMLEKLGGTALADIAETSKAEVIFFMVMNGAQISDILWGKSKLLEQLAAGTVLVITATITPEEIIEVYEKIQQQRPEIMLIDSPVSGGKSGADSGALTLMQAGDQQIIEQNEKIFAAISKKRYYVGSKVGMGQKTKAALQAFIGCSFAGLFEALVLGSKAGVDGEVLYNVFSHSSAGSPLAKNCMKLILERKFKGTGSQIGTMYKDLGISMEMARQYGAMMPTTAASYELFQAGISVFPEEDNWTIVKFLEGIAHTEVKSENKDAKTTEEVE